LNEIKKNGKAIYRMILKDDFKSYGKLLRNHWECKKKLNSKINNKNTKKIIEICKKYRIDGYRVVGAGAGGYILAYGKNTKDLQLELNYKKIVFIKFNLDQNGTKVIYNSN